MNSEEIIKEWCAELRSGTWEQLAAGMGKDGSCERCCLGVLCELAIKHGVIGPPTSQYPRSDFLLYEGKSCTLPYAVRTWARLRTETGEYWDDKRGRYSLAAANDNGKTFEEIAIIIESRPDGLFEEGV